ncbi:hypothetical protein [uncultured Cetobacterium sp.]|uniref:hypothetical protein n=1 Tax=uncultured Cetobacterium sp. TaxID=527638 RepID=UPI0026274CB1|nr:hypothetical protein [uncultured Cetobacterium sp.]
MKKMTKLEKLKEKNKEIQKLINDEKKKEDTKKKQGLNRHLKYAIEFINFIEIYEKPELMYGAIDLIKKMTEEEQRNFYLKSLDLKKSAGVERKIRNSRIKKDEKND